MNIIDRYLLRQFLQTFLICFMSLTGVYVIFDAFTNLEAFMSLAKGLTLIKIIAAYYGYQSLFFFDRISSLLVLMSAMFTMAWIQRHHEMTALMAAGISRIRVVAPVLVASVAIILLAVINREIVIPKIKDQLAMRPSDLKGNVVEELLPQYDNASNVLIEGRCAVTDKKQIEMPVFVVPPDEPSLCKYGKQWSAALATYLPAKDGRPTGYLLSEVSEPKNLTQRPSLSLDGRSVLITPHDHPEWLKPNEVFVVSDVTVDELTGGMVLRRFASTGELIWALKNHSIYFSPDVRVTIHSRILQPLLDITLLFLGLPLVAARDNRNVFVAIGMCVGLVALFFIVAIACQQLGANCLIRPPALAAWIPLMIFVPSAVGMSSAMWER
ncbi:MAG: LptF/LptG family permease [Thermoguttaceae bacterium]